MSMLSRFATLGSGLGPPDPYFASVSYLLVGNGANGTTANIVDSSNNHVTTTITGNTQISTAQSKFGSGSVYFDGTGDYLDLSANFSLSGDFTVEFWAYFSSLSGSNPMIFGSGATGWGSGACAICVEAGSQRVKLFTYASSGLAIVQTPVLSTGQWYHIALVRSGSTIKMYLNGVSTSSASNADNLFSTSTSRLGFNGWDSPTGNQFNGYLYDFRVTKGVARYTADNTPPPFPPTSAMPTYGP